MQASDINTITSRFFQPALSVAPIATSDGLLADRLGRVVTDIEDIDQCIHIIALTPLGSDPHRPDFGCDLNKYLDYPLPRARPYIARTLQQALTRWEPRMNLVSVKVSLDHVAALLVAITWQIASAYNDQIFVTNLVLGQLA